MVKVFYKDLQYLTRAGTWTLPGFKDILVRIDYFMMQ